MPPHFLGCGRQLRACCVEKLDSRCSGDASLLHWRHPVLCRLCSGPGILRQREPWVYGVLVNNVWSLTSDKQGGSYSNGLIQPFVNYNFLSAPILTAAWNAPSGPQWTVPLGGRMGKIFHFGKLPVNTQISAYYNVAHPDFGPNWQIRAQVQLMFPK